MSGAPHVVLVGLPGSGKSTVGRAVAEQLGVDFIDLDETIESGAGATVREIFARGGEEEFRRLEVEATRQLLERTSPAVVAAGGGWIGNTRARELVPGRWAILYLRVSPRTAVDRLGAGAMGRPLLAAGGQESVQERLEELATRRTPLYERADIVMETDGVPLDEIVERAAAAVSAVLSGSSVEARRAQ